MEQWLVTWKTLRYWNFFTAETMRAKDRALYTGKPIKNFFFFFNFSRESPSNQSLVKEPADSMYEADSCKNNFNNLNFNKLLFFLQEHVAVLSRNFIHALCMNNRITCLKLEDNRLGEPCPKFCSEF